MNRVTEDYCIEQMRRLSDREFILITLDKLMKSGEMKLTEHDTTAEKYLKRNPGCCRVYGHKPFSGKPIYVSVIYELSDSQKKIQRAVD